MRYIKNAHLPKDNEHSGADDGGRTHMILLSQEPESCASANSATSASAPYYIIIIRRFQQKYSDKKVGRLPFRLSFYLLERTLMESMSKSPNTALSSAVNDIAMLSENRNCDVGGNSSSPS